MGTAYVRHARLRGDAVIATGDAAPNSTTPTTAQPVGTRFIAFGEQGLSSVANRAIGAVQENVDTLHAALFGELAIPRSYDKQGAVINDAGTYVIRMNATSPLRCYVYAAGNTTADIAKIVSILNEDFEEIVKAGVTLQVTNIRTDQPSGTSRRGVNDNALCVCQCCRVASRS